MHPKSILLAGVAACFCGAMFTQSVVGADAVKPAAAAPATLAATAPATTQANAKSSLKIISASWGAKKKQTDVTDIIASKVQGDHLDLVVADTDFGKDPAPNMAKTLIIVYETGGKRKTEKFPEKGTVSIVAAKPDVSDADELAALRKKYPTGVVVLQAKWGRNNEWKDVTDVCQRAVEGDSLTIPVSPETFQDAHPMSKELHLKYENGEGVKTLVITDGSVFQEGKKVTSFVKAKMGLTPVAETVAAMRKKIPEGLLVLGARWGGKFTWQDETDICQSAVSGDSMTVENTAAAFHEASGSQKDLVVTYWDGQEVKEVTAGENGTVQVGKKVTSFVRPKLGLVNIEEAVKELRKKYPTGLLVLGARWGKERDGRDVTDLCQKMVSGDSLTFSNTAAAFSEGWANNMDLDITYWTGDELKTATAGLGGFIQIGKKVTSFVRFKAGIMNADEAVADLRKSHPTGLLILDAKWGKDNEWKDVRDICQDAVKGDSLSLPNKAETFHEGWSGGKVLQVTYYDGEVKETTTGDGGTLQISGTSGKAVAIDPTLIKPGALKNLGTIPAHAIVGKPFSFKFGALGNYRLVKGPDGATLNQYGKLEWTPAPGQVGMQTFEFTVKGNKNETPVTQTCEVVSASVGAAAGGDLDKIASLSRLDLAGGEHEYVPNIDLGNSLLLEKNQLTLIGADGTTIASRLQLAHDYVRIAERKDYYIGIRLDPMVMDLIDKTTGKPTKTIKLGYRKFHDVALVPGKSISFVSVEYAASVPRDRIVIVDENSGEVTEPKGLAGTFLQIDRAGKHLWVGIKDIYENGMEYHINPDWNVVEIPQYGNIDMLLRFDMENGQLVKKDFLAEAGGNGSGIRVSPDGKRVTYLSFTGFPMFTKNLPAWNAMDFEKKPVNYEIKGKADTKALAYHPVLPLVAIPKEGGVLIFGRDTGDEEPQRVNVGDALAGVIVKNAWFSADGLNVILDCEKSGKGFLYKAPLVVSAAEKAEIAEGVKPVKTGTPAVPAKPVSPAVHQNL